MKKILVMFFVAFALALAGNTAAKAADIELIAGGGAWWNNLAEGDFLYGEGMPWFNGEYSFGAGPYAMKESGESKLTAYEWDGQLAGPQVGFKRYWLDNESNLARQWQLKIRYVWEETSGENKQSGYKMSQDTNKLGGYAEYVRELDERWIGSLQLEGWKTLSKERTSTWAGDRPENRDQACGGVFAQYRVNDPLSLKAGVSLFWQGWDEMTGVRVQGEVRLYEHLMVGAYVSTPFGVPQMYEQYNAEVADLVTTGIYGRAEF